ncbi:MAG: hypothetical protein IJQ77_08860 [Synergistaceae bacterium]|nr:hypothetical protein [Synergistaceae bacterium]MBR0251179.1 hypothetical protein [Synergistaceae bacterium]
MYRVTLGNGKILEGVSIEGVTLFTQEKIKREDFEYGLHDVKITKTSNDESDIDVEIAEGTYQNMKLITCCECRYKPGYMMFQFAPMSEQEKRELKVDSRLDYLEMMTE